MIEFFGTLVPEWYGFLVVFFAIFLIIISIVGFCRFAVEFGNKVRNAYKDCNQDKQHKEDIQ